MGHSTIARMKELLNSKDDFKSYKQLHGIDMQIHSIPKSPKQKALDMGLFDLHDEEFKNICPGIQHNKH
jgi:hypothetical protein